MQNILRIPLKCLISSLDTNSKSKLIFNNIIMGNKEIMFIYQNDCETKYVKRSMRTIIYENSSSSYSLKKAQKSNHH